MYLSVCLESSEHCHPLNLCRQPWLIRKAVSTQADMQSRQLLLAMKMVMGHVMLCHLEELHNSKSAAKAHTGAHASSQALSWLHRKLCLCKLALSCSLPQQDLYEAFRRSMLSKKASRHG